ncbi:MAG: hypothetical protein WAZ14_02860 [Patescibacteria group bacterium]
MSIQLALDPEQPDQYHHFILIASNLEENGVTYAILSPEDPGTDPEAYIACGYEALCNDQRYYFPLPINVSQRLVREYRYQRRLEHLANTLTETRVSAVIQPENSHPPPHSGGHMASDKPRQRYDQDEPHVVITDPEYGRRHYNERIPHTINKELGETYVALTPHEAHLPLRVGKKTRNSSLELLRRGNEANNWIFVLVQFEICKRSRTSGAEA